MAEKFSSVVKITRPRLSRVFPRKRLFRLLDRSRGRPVTWISGPAGSGKTTLVASYLDVRKLPCLWYQVDEGDAEIATFFYYMGLAGKKAAPQGRTPLPLLTPEYLFGIPTFTKRYFENLYSRFKPPFIIVFDNYQEVPVESPFHEVMQNALSNIPRGINVIVVSRSDPPPTLARLRASNAVEMIGWEKLRLTPDESKGIIELHIKRKPTKEVVQRLHEKTEGWAAGLVLLTGRAKTEERESRSSGRLSHEEVFDYFAGEVFSKLDSETRDFLLMTAFLPRMTAQTAERLTDQENAGQILSGLSRNHFFTVKHSTAEPVYQYHPLFREFLLTRIKEALSQEGILHIQKRAAALLEESGQIEDAAGLFIEAADWDGLIRLILKQAVVLTKEGRSKTLEAWLTSLPLEIRESNPWLLYWKGVCTMPFSPAQARNDFGRAFELFSSMQDRAGMFLSWSGAVESSLHEGEFMQLDEKLALLNEVFREDIVFPSPEIEARVTMSVFNALSLRQPHHPEMGKWKQKALALFRNQQGLNINIRLTIGTFLGVHYFYTGDMASAALVIDLLARLSSAEVLSEMVTISVKNTNAFYYLFAGSYRECLRNVYEGIRLADETGVHVWDWHIIGHGVAAALSAGDLETADALFKRFPKIETARRFDKGYYHYLNSWRSLLRGDAAYALEELRLCVSLFDAIGFSLLQPVAYAGLAEVLHERGEENEAGAYLTKAYEMGVSAKSAFTQCKCLLVRSRFCFEKGDEAEGLDHLRRAMRLAKENGLVNVACWRRSVMTDLCMRALEAGIEADYVRILIQKLKLMPEFPPLHIENWPWPLRIYTLGRFEIVKDDKPVTFSGKVQKRPLDMLKALVAFGGKDAGEEQITDALWPDAEGDAAPSTFKSNLHRLRRILGCEDALPLQEGRLRLDPRQCWVDAWAFEMLVDEAVQSSECGLRSAESEKNRSASRNTQSEIAQRLETALALYRGHFLTGDEDKPWAVSYRERLRKKFLRAVVMLGRLHEQAGEHTQAVSAYERGLEVDDLAEDLYRRLMQNLHKLGRKAEALSAYERFRKTLHAAFGIAPSEETEALRCRIRES